MVFHFVPIYISEQKYCAIHISKPQAWQQFFQEFIPYLASLERNAKLFLALFFK